MFGIFKRKKEISKGGSEIHRHKDSNRKDWRPRIPDESCIYLDEICAYFDKLYPNRETTVFHEIVSDLVHIDVHVMKPTPEDDFYVVYTTGMSDLPMAVPNEIPNAQDYKHAELFMFLPSSWNPHSETSTDPTLIRGTWAIPTIKFFARMPHEYKTWLGGGHTIPNGPDYDPFLEGSELSGVVLLDYGGEDGSYLIANDGTRINTLMLMPLTRAETEYKLEHGMGALIDRLEEHDVPMIIDMYRKSAV